MRCSDNNWLSLSLDLGDVFIAALSGEEGALQNDSFSPVFIRLYKFDNLLQISSELL